MMRVRALQKQWMIASLCSTLSLGAIACSDDHDTTKPQNNTENNQADMRPDLEPDPNVLPAKLRFTEVSLGEEVTAMTELKFIPGTSRFLILRKTGEVLLFELESTGQAKRLGRFEVPGVFDEADCGLISAAFDPDFAQNKFVYFGYCTGIGENAISRHVLDPEALEQVGPSGKLIIEAQAVDAEKAWHNVGSMAFDAQGYLWGLFGENALQDPAQDPANTLGSLVRIKPNRSPDGQGYEPAPDNPFVGQAGKSDAVYALGLRSPWRGHLDSQGRFWIGDVGAAEIEEINIVTKPGQNFGWPKSEGPCKRGCEGQTDPLIHWNRSLEHPFAFDDDQTAPTTRRAVWVGVEHRPASAVDPYQGRLKGKVLYGDFCTGWVRTAIANDRGALSYDANVGHLEGVVSWDQGPQDHLYVVTYGNCFTFPYKPGKLYRAELVEE